MLKAGFGGYPSPSYSPAGFVALGVVLEFGGDWIARPFEKVVSDAREREMLALVNETKRLSAEAETARAQIAEAQARAAEATQKTREAELALEKLRQNQLPRVLTPEQQAEIATATGRFRGQRFTITSLMGDSEGRDLAMQIVAALDQAGWDHDGPAGMGRVIRTDNPIGVRVELNPANTDTNSVPAGTNELVQLFVKFGLMKGPTVTRMQDPRMQPPVGTIGILVGTKPIVQ